MNEKRLKIFLYCRTLVNLEESFLLSYFSFLFAGVGAENQAEEGASQGKRDGSKTGGITFKKYNLKQNSGSAGRLLEKHGYVSGRRQS